MAPVDYVAFGIIVDDIIFPDGKTVMGELGGGGVQAAFGMRVWSDRVGLVAGIGADLPEPAQEWLAASGIDLEGVRDTSFPTLRAWQVMENDGRRTQLWRVPGEALQAQMVRSIERLPEAYRQARGYHYGIHPEDPDLSFVTGLRALGGLVSLEPYKGAERPLSPLGLAALVRTANVFSPNVAEAVSMSGPGEPLELAQRLARAGAEVVALRMGETGSLMLDGANRKVARVPAVPTHLVDPVGAGNAYCGGFLVGWGETKDILTAGLYGAVSASFVVEQVGVPQVGPDLRAEARRRLDSLREQVSVEQLEI